MSLNELTNHIPEQICEPASMLQIEPLNIRLCVEDRWSGISLGLECEYRLLKRDDFYLFFDCTTGRIVESMIPEENAALAEDFAVKRLYEINGISRWPSAECLAAIDAVS